MDTNLLLILILSLTGISVITQLILLLHIEKYREIKSGDFPEIDKTLKNARDKADEIIARSIKAANKILTNAELKGIKILSRSKLDSRYYAAEFKHHLELLENNLVKHFNSSLASVQDSYNSSVKALQQSAAGQETVNKKLMDEKIRQLTDTSQKAITDFIIDINSRIKTQLDSELIAAKGEIIEFKKSRMKIIDAHIVEMLENILEKTLTRKLSLSDQSELIFKALEQAKNDQAWQ